MLMFLQHRVGLEIGEGTTFFVIEERGDQPATHLNPNEYYIASVVDKQQND